MPSGSACEISRHDRFAEVCFVLFVRRGLSAKETSPARGIGDDAKNTLTNVCDVVFDVPPSEQHSQLLRKPRQGRATFSNPTGSRKNDHPRWDARGTAVGEPACGTIGELQTLERLRMVRSNPKSWSMPWQSLSVNARKASILCIAKNRHAT